MKSEVVRFPWGTAEGYPALYLDFEGDAFDPEKADAELERHGAATGLWAVWLDNIETWEAPGLSQWLAAHDEGVIAVRRLEGRDWPAARCWTVLDVSVLKSNLRDIEALAEQASELLGPNPVVEDVVLRLEHDDDIPLAEALDLINDIGAPSGGACHLYAPADHRGWPLILRAVSRASSLWSLRRA